jgi:hypothetical protein
LILVVLSLLVPFLLIGGVCAHSGHPMPPAAPPPAWTAPAPAHASCSKTRCTNCSAIRRTHAR